MGLKGDVVKRVEEDRPGDPLETPKRPREPFPSRGDLQEKGREGD